MAEEVPVGGAECSICLVNIVRVDTSTVVQLGCLRFFHKDCINEWFSTAPHRTCPICRAEFSDPVGPAAMALFTLVAGSLMLAAAYFALF